MSLLVDGSIPFTVASGASGYPLRAVPDGTATQGSSDFANASSIILEAVIVESEGSANGVLTIHDHAATTATDINIDIATDAASITPHRVIPFGPYGIGVPWKGIGATLTGTAIRCRVIFRCA